MKTKFFIVVGIDVSLLDKYVDTNKITAEGQSNLAKHLKVELKDRVEYEIQSLHEDGLLTEYLLMNEVNNESIDA